MSLPPPRPPLQTICEMAPQKDGCLSSANNHSLGAVSLAVHPSSFVSDETSVNPLVVALTWLWTFRSFLFFPVLQPTPTLPVPSQMSTAESSVSFKASFFSSTFFFFLGPRLQHMEVPRLGVKSEQLPAYTTATATWDPSHVCDLQCNSGQPRLGNPLSEVRNQIRSLMDTSWARYRRASMGIPLKASHNYNFMINWNPSFPQGPYFS